MTFKKQTFEWKTALNWRDMLVDAPASFSPHWLGTIEDKKLAAHCQKLYMQLRRDADNGNGVSLLRDLVLRRIVWSVRILERIEQAIVHWDKEVDACFAQTAELEQQLKGVRKRAGIKAERIANGLYADLNAKRAATGNAEERLANYMRYHTHQCHELIYAIETILVEMPPIKTVQQIYSPGRDRNKVHFSETNEDDIYDGN